ncbi:MAG: chromosome segregation protein SMC [Verrucomicrobiota bacterium]|nr:chromosome segregation protein SMC [Verrucomicrobiota bacterium]
MYLSSLKANGFKSFADKTHLRFDPGVTAVVGPNGCGKSNIADAIRWVLGEQSAKALRGGKMQDVIFEGTDKRKPLNICEVSIILTDCEKELGQEFNEVELTRRVHRDGGSNYYINGKNCRLRDIQRLFMDTGVGRTSYSVMAQGQIDQILSSKPEERRAVLEEAAGISKYKAQRKEALNKLARVETNLDRVTDVIAEINRQIGSLRRQATKAIRYRKLSHKLRHLDVGYNAYQYRALKSDLDNIDKDAGGLQFEVDDYQKDVEQKESRLTVYKEERQALIQKIQDSQQAVFDLRSAKEQAANQTHMSEIRITSMKERIDQAQEEIRSFETQIQELGSRLESHSADKELHLDVVGSSDEVFQERNRDLADIEARLESSEREIQTLRSRLEEGESALQDCREQLSLLEVETGTGSNRLEQLTVELKEQEEGVAKAESELERFNKEVEAAESRKKNLDTELSKIQDQVTETRDAFRAIQGKIQELDRIVAQKSARVKLLQQLQEKLEGYGEGSKALMKGRMQGSLAGRSFSPIASNLSIKDGYGLAIESLLGSAIEAVAVNDADTVVEIFKQLENREIGRACVKLSSASRTSSKPAKAPDWLEPATRFVSLSEDAGPVESVLGACFIVDDLEKFLSWWKTNSEFPFLQVASKKGESIDSRGLVTGGFRKANSSSILQREIELKKIAKELEKDQIGLKKARDEAEALNASLEEAEKSVETCRREIGETNQELSRLQAEAGNAERSLNDQKSKIERTQRERELLEESLARSTEKLEAVKTRLQQDLSSIAEVREKLGAIETNVVKTRNERDDKREALSQAKFDLQEKKRKLDMLEQGVVETEQRRSELIRLVDTKSADIEQWNIQIDEQKEAIKESSKRCEALFGEIAESKAAVEKNRESLASIEDKVNILEKEQTYTRDKLDNLKSSLNDRQVRLAEKRSKLGFIQEETEREYGVDLRLIDWKWEIWKARQPVPNLPKLDLDRSTDNEDSDTDEGTSEEPSSGVIEAEKGVEVDSGAEISLEDSQPMNALPDSPSEEELEALDDTNWSKIKSEVQSVRKRVQGMGAVNTDAIEEYGELRERHHFLKTQYDDLIESRDKLVEAIEEINTKSREQFSQTFDQIQANFKHTFTSLFGGGKADLRLMESEDVLESGIDIVAQPPGTRLKNISLLSGGQRTMTAVGLLFAIYMVKPSPFCLLDELDAPLDESNIGRFTGLLKQFRAQSQFIIITHNKRTIQAAEAIYGVTMEEKGVSKVVSMKFNSEHEDSDLVSLQLEKEPALV